MLCKVDSSTAKCRLQNPVQLYAKQQGRPFCTSTPCRWLEAHHRFVEQEAKIMEGVDGWEPGKSVYSSKVWMPPARDVGVWGGA